MKLCVPLYAFGAACVLCASFATDWRAGVAVTGAGALAGAWLIDVEPEEGP